MRINRFIESERDRHIRHLEERMRATLYIYSISSAGQKITLEPIMEDYENRYERITGKHYQPVWDELQKRTNGLKGVVA